MPVSVSVPLLELEELLSVDEPVLDDVVEPSVALALVVLVSSVSGGDIVVSDEPLLDEVSVSVPVASVASVVLVVGNTSSVAPLVGASVSMKNGFSSMHAVP